VGGVGAIPAWVRPGAWNRPEPGIARSLESWMRHHVEMALSTSGKTPDPASVGFEARRL
jgi:hypothetical protein